METAKLIACIVGILFFFGVVLAWPLMKFAAVAKFIFS